MKTSVCHICGSGSVAPLLNFGNQALCNRFLSSPADAEAEFPMTIGQCGDCGLVQIVNPVSPSELRPRFDWISYNEQEGHLDHLVEMVGRLRGLTPDSQIGALSFKDDSTVERFRKKGFARTWRLDPAADLNITESNAGLETVQAYLTPQRAKLIAAKRGKSDLLIVRHILEHAHQPNQFAATLRELIQPNGCLVFEVPDCAPALQRCDYTMPWEEHVVYYTPDTFQRSLASLGFSLVHYHCYPYANENSLIGIAQFAQTKPVVEKAEVDLHIARAYGEAFPKYRERVVRTLKSYRERHGKIAVFGAGHLSCAWVNFLQVQESVEFFVDDHPKKRGMFMPGSRLPIRGSADLLGENIKLCLLSLSPESEVKVIGKNQAFLDQGGTFASIFPGKSNALTLET